MKLFFPHGTPSSGVLLVRRVLQFPHIPQRYWHNIFVSRVKLRWRKDCTPPPPRKHLVIPFLPRSLTLAIPAISFHSASGWNTDRFFFILFCKKVSPFLFPPRDPDRFNHYGEVNYKFAYCGIRSDFFFLRLASRVPYHASLIVPSLVVLRARSPPCPFSREPFLIWFQFTSFLMEWPSLQPPNPLTSWVTWLFLPPLLSTFCHLPPLIFAIIAPVLE